MAQDILKFTKMHGAGNDYVYVNAIDQTIVNPKELAIKVSDRHFGVGADGLVIILPAENSDFKMRMFNADGSEAQMCGNAVRCVAKFIYEKGLSSKETITLETLGGVQILNSRIENGIVTSVQVDMGAPILDVATIPLNPELTNSNQVEIKIDSEVFKAFCVSMGNPHAVIFVDKITDKHVLEYGPKIEKHQLFPEKVNVEFIESLNRNKLKMRVWERGSGETLACGTGAAAACVAAISLGIADTDISVELPGGTLDFFWKPGNHVLMTGPATTVFEGTLNSGNL